jgi:Ca-activated chloride channel homolog
MKRFKRRGLFLWILCIFLIVGCSHKTESETKAPGINSKAESEEKQEIPKAARTLEEMIDQKEGVLVAKYMDKEIEAITGWNGMDYNNFYDETFQPKAEKELRTYFEKQKDLTADEVYDYLVYMLGSGRYREYYDQLTAYEHGFVMPELPDGPDEIETKQKKMNVVVLMDASGSMKEKVSGGVKMDLAKDAIGKFIEQIPEEANVSLLAYGHVGTGKDSDKTKSCSAVEPVYPLNPYDSTSFTKALNSFNASGWTPLAGAIEKAHDMLKPYDNEDYHNEVFIVSDGIETCDGDPVQAAKKLQDSNIKANVNIIGFDVDDQGQQQLKRVAEAGAGEYATVRDKSELEITILKKWRPTIGQLVFTQGVGLKEMTEAMKRMNDIYNPLYEISNREMHRIKNAAYFLNTEELISDEVEDEVLRIADDMYELRQSHFEEIKTQKEAERDAASKEINDKVEAWRKKWEEELGEDAYKL